jgi:hypothetical protein
MLAALHAIRKENCAKVIVAAPICSFEAYNKLKRQKTRKLEEIIILNIPPSFKWLAQFYMDFTPCTDIQVMEALRENRSRPRDSSSLINRRTSINSGRDSRSHSLASSDSASDVEEKEEEDMIDSFGDRFFLRDLQTGHKRGAATPRHSNLGVGVVQTFFPEDGTVKAMGEVCVDTEPLKTA